MLGIFGGGLIAVLCLLVALGFGNYYGINLLIVRLTAIDREQRGTIMGLQTTVSNLAVFAGASIFGLIYSAGDFVAVAYTGMAFALVAALASKVRPKAR
jgi:DHA1 family inner membrane transport protein